jgi:hypothetical protein
VPQIELPEHQPPDDESIYYLICAGFTLDQMTEHWLADKRELHRAAIRFCTGNITICDCSARTKHALLHRWHPQGGRLNCTVCHPPSPPIPHYEPLPNRYQGES